MTRILASAAAPRLRRAAQAGAGRLSAVCRRQVREHTHVLEDWARAARQCGWVSNQPALRRGSVLGTELDRFCSGDAHQPTRDPAHQRANRPALSKPTAKKQKKPAYLSPASTAPTAPVEPCTVPDATPKRVGSGRLRLWSGKDVPETPATVAKTPRTFEKPGAAVPAPVPALASQPDWAANLAKRVARQLAAETALPDSASGIKSGFARPLSGETAPLSLLENAKLGKRTRNSLASPDPTKTGRSRQEAPKPARNTRKTGSVEPVASNTTDAARATEPAQSKGVGGKGTNWIPDTPAAPAPVLDPAVATARHAPDPLISETIHPPRHRTPVQLPPQPDLDPPFAEIVPQESRAALGPAQSAVADEPLTELPPPPAAALSRPGFDREELGKALARVLRDEARRHGIDV